MLAKLRLPLSYIVAFLIVLCLTPNKDEKFAVHLNTEGKGVEDVAEEIAYYAGLNINPPTWHPIFRPLKRMIVQIRHIRF